MAMKIHQVEGILRGRPHVTLSVDGVWNKQVMDNYVTSGVIKRSFTKTKLGSERQNIP